MVKGVKNSPIRQTGAQRVGRQPAQLQELSANKAQDVEVVTASTAHIRDITAQGAEAGALASSAKRVTFDPGKQEGQPSGGVLGFLGQRNKVASEKPRAPDGSQLSLDAELMRLNLPRRDDLALDYAAMQERVDAFDPAKTAFRAPHQPIPPSMELTYQAPSSDRPPTTLVATTFMSFDPIVDGADARLADPVLQAWLETPEPGVSLNVENSDTGRVRELVRQRVAKHPEWLQETGAESIDHLSPKQAALIAARVTTDVMEYNYSALDVEGALDPSTHLAIEKLREVDPELAERMRSSLPTRLRDDIQRMDLRGIEELFAPQQSEENPRGETGVCRNYAEVFQGVFEALKAEQSGSTLSTTYVKQVAADCHMYSALYHVQPDGKLVFTVLDPTRADSARDLDVKSFEYRLDGKYFPESYSVLTATVADLHAGALGISKQDVFSDFMVVWMRAIDLSAQGQAAQGAKLLKEYLDSVPSPHAVEMKHYTRGLLDDEYNKGWWPAGKTELMTALDD